MTMRDVAKLAGVSSAAVSRYLNGGYISKEKAERVRAAIAETGYTPSHQARALRTGSNRLIGVIVPKINSESVSRITAGIGQVLRERGYQMLLADTENHAERELTYLDLFQSYPVDGIVLVATVLTPAHREALLAARVPVVMVGQDMPGVSCVSHDDYHAAFDLARAIARGHEGDVGYIGVLREDAAAGAGREDGFEAGLAAAGRGLPADLRREGSFTVESGYEAARDLIAAHPGLAFIACATDTMAAGAYRALAEAGAAEAAARHVSGFGDNVFLRAITGGIPTVHFSYLTSGIEGTTMLLDAIDAGGAEERHLRLGYELILPAPFRDR